MLNLCHDRATFASILFARPLKSAPYWLSSPPDALQVMRKIR